MKTCLLSVQAMIDETAMLVRREFSEIKFHSDHRYPLIENVQILPNINKGLQNQLEMKSVGFDMWGLGRGKKL